MAAGRTASRAVRHEGSRDPTLDPGTGRPTRMLMNTLACDRANLQRLAETLWEERRVVERLHYRLTCAKLLLAADASRFVPLAIDEVDDVVDELQEIELLREGLLADVADDLGHGGQVPSLAALTELAPAPFDRIFADHRTAFLRLADEIERTTDANRELAAQALGRVRTAIGSIGGTGVAAGTYDAAGRPAPADAVPLRMDRAL